MRIDVEAAIEIHDQHGSVELDFLPRGVRDPGKPEIKKHAVRLAVVVIVGREWQ